MFGLLTGKRGEGVRWAVGEKFKQAEEEGEEKEKERKGERRGNLTRFSFFPLHAYRNYAGPRIENF